MKMILILSLIFCSLSCAYHSTTKVMVSGEDVRYGLIKGKTLELIINREVKVGK